MTQTQIAKECGTGQSYVCELLSGKRKSPNWELGHELIMLHNRVCSKDQIIVLVDRRTKKDRRVKERRIAQAKVIQ